MSLLREQKAELRARMRAARSGLSSATRRERSAAIAEAIRDLESFRAASLIMSYSSMSTEVDTAPIHDFAWDLGKSIVLPRVRGDDINAIAYEPGDLLEVSAFGVLEPVGPAAEPGDIDLVIVPGLVFDSAGGRIGYGAGYYDRFLPELPTDAVTIGVCFVEQLVDNVPYDAHDIELDLVVTGTGVL